MAGANPVVMPKLGLTMTEGLLASWRVAPGDEVKAGDVLFVVETEKIATEIEAAGPGRIESLLANEGDVVPVGAPVALWTGESSRSERPETPDAAENVSRSATEGVSAVPAVAAERRLSTPLARRIAREKGVDLAALQGSGPRGRIKAADVEAAAPRAHAPADHASPQRRPATPVERIVADRLSASKRTIPHFYVLADADVTELLHVRAELNAGGAEPKFTVNHFVVAALARALAQAPEFGVRWTDGMIETVPGSGVGIAVDTPRGLIVPVLRDAGTLGLEDLARDASALVLRAREGRLLPGDTAGAVISVSNVGMTGVAHLVPIIDPDQSAILGVGAIKPVFRPDAEGRPALRQEMGLVLACDHRVFDGMRAARFLDRVVQGLNHPLRLLRAEHATGVRS